MKKGRLTKREEGKIKRILDWDYQRYISEFNNPGAEAIERHKRLVKYYVKERNKLKNPVNKRTGQPLKPSTIKQYQCGVDSYKFSIRAKKVLFKKMRNEGYFNFLRSSKLHKIVLETKRTLTAREKAFVEAYKGNGIIAARKSGYRGNFLTIKKIACGLLRDRDITVSIKRKNRERISAGLFMVKGGGQGNRRGAFKIRPVGDCDKTVVHLGSYSRDIFYRFGERIDRFAEVLYGSGVENLYNPDGTCNERKTRAFHVHHELHNLVHGLFKKFIKNNVEDPPLDEFEKVKEKIQEAEKEFGLQLGNYKGW